MSSAKAAIWLDLITSGIAESSDTEGLWVAYGGLPIADIADDNERCKKSVLSSDKDS